MGKLISAKFYRLNNEYVVLEAELASKPQDVLKDDFTLEEIDGGDETDYLYIEDMHFLNRDGTECIDDNIDNDADYTRFAATMYGDDMKYVAEHKYKLRTLYGEFPMSALEDCPERLKNTVKFVNEQGDVVKEGGEESKPEEKFDLKSAIKEADSGDIKKIHDLIFYYTLKDKNLNERIKWNLKLIEIAPERGAYGNLYEAYMSTDDDINAEKYIDIGVRYGNKKCLFVKGAELFDDENYGEAINIFSELLANSADKLSNSIDINNLYAERDSIKYLIDIYHNSPHEFGNAPLKLEEALRKFAEAGYTLAQFLLASLYVSGSFGRVDNDSAIELYLKCLAFRDEYDSAKTESTMIIRKMAIDSLLNISDNSDPRIAPYVIESKFIFTYCDESFNFGKPVYDGLMSFEYEHYMRAIDPKLNNVAERRKVNYKNMSAHLVARNYIDNRYLNCGNVTLYWSLKAAAAGLDETFDEYLLHEKDFSKAAHRRMMADLNALALSGDEEADKIMEICQEYPFLMCGATRNVIKSADKTMESCQDNSCLMSNAKRSDSESAEAVTRADKLVEGIARFKLKDYETARERFLEVEAEEAENTGGKDNKRLKTAYKYLVKIYKKGLGVKKDAYTAVSYKNKIKRL